MEYFETCEGIAETDGVPREVLCDSEADDVGHAVDGGDGLGDVAEGEAATGSAGEHGDAGLVEVERVEVSGVDDVEVPVDVDLAVAAAREPRADVGRAQEGVALDRVRDAEARELRPLGGRERLQADVEHVARAQGVLDERGERGRAVAEQVREDHRVRVAEHRGVRHVGVRVEPQHAEARAVAPPEVVDRRLRHEAVAAEHDDARRRLGRDDRLRARHVRHHRALRRHAVLVRKRRPRRRVHGDRPLNVVGAPRRKKRQQLRPKVVLLFRTSLPVGNNKSQCLLHFQGEITRSFTQKKQICAACFFSQSIVWASVSEPAGSVPSTQSQKREVGMFSMFET